MDAEEAVHLASSSNVASVYYGTTVACGLYPQAEVRSTRIWTEVTCVACVGLFDPETQRRWWVNKIIADILRGVLDAKRRVHTPGPDHL
jgi:hypothetical protein